MNARLPLRLLTWIIALPLFGSAALAAGAPELRPFTATYNIIQGKSQVGNAELQLQRSGDGRWSYLQRVQIKGMKGGLMSLLTSMPADQTTRSLVLIQDGRVIPQQFSANDNAGPNRSDQKLDFDWKRGRVTGVFDRKPVDLSTQPGLLDSQSAQLALMIELMAGRAPQRLVLVEKGRIRDYIYSREQSAETLSTAIGEYRTVVYRSSRPGSDKTTLFWCAPDLGYLPLKVERRDGKDLEFSMAVKTVAIDGVKR